MGFETMFFMWQYFDDVVLLGVLVSRFYNFLGYMGQVCLEEILWDMLMFFEILGLMWRAGLESVGRHGLPHGLML